MFTAANMLSVALCHILSQVNAKYFLINCATLLGTDEGFELPKGGAHIATAVQWRQ